MTRNISLRLLLGTSLLFVNALGCDDDEPTNPGMDATSDAPMNNDTGTTPDAAAPDVSQDVNNDATPTTDGGDGGVVLSPQAEHGRYLVTAVIGCPECHTPRLPTGALDMTKWLAGEADGPTCLFAVPNTSPPQCVHPRNLTSDATGLKNRSDAEIKDMFMHGKRPAPTGGGATEALSPVMPYYVFSNMTDADANDIVAYLRTVPPVHNEISKRAAAFDLPMPAPGLTPAKIPSPMTGYSNPTEAARGKYLATQIGLCVECHSKHLAPGSPTVLNEDTLFQGGEDFTGALGPTFPFPIVSKNLTSDATTGLGTWTFQQVSDALTMGKDKMGKGICPPMPYGMSGYGNLKPEDLNAIVHYIKSLPPAVHMVPDMCTFPPGT